MHDDQRLEAPASEDSGTSFDPLANRVSEVSAKQRAASGSPIFGHRGYFPSILRVCPAASSQRISTSVDTPTLAPVGYQAHPRMSDTCIERY